MAEYTADFEAGTLDATIATTDPGSATAWDAVVISSGTHALTYSDDQVHRGARAAHIVAGATPGTAYLQWTKTFANEHFGRFYIYRAGSFGTDIIVAARSSDTNGDIVVLAANQVRIRGAGQATLATGAQALPLNAWSRVEYRIKEADAPAGEMEVRLFLGSNADGTTPDETISATGVDTLGAGATTLMRFGLGNSAATRDFYLDDIVANATTWPGPPVTFTPGPARFAGPRALGTSAATMFTVPAGLVCRLETISISNPTAGAIDLTMSIGADAVGTRYLDGLSIPADSEVTQNVYVPLAAGEFVQAYGSSSGLVLALDGTVF